MPSSQPQDSPAVDTGSIEALPTELITLIANDLDTKSLKQLRLCCSRLYMTSSLAFEPRLACVPFWFMPTSMQRLALLSESRWSQHVETLAIMSSCPSSGKRENLDIPYPRALWTSGGPEIRHYNLHMGSVRLDPARGAPSEIRFGTMANVHTLVLNLGCVYEQDVLQRRLLPALCSALPNLTTLQLVRVEETPGYFQMRAAGRLTSAASLASSCMPCLRCLCILDCNFQTLREVVDVVRTHKDSLRSVEVRRTSGRGWLRLLQVLRHELPLLENVVFEDNERFRGSTMGILWPDGTYDTGQLIREMVRENGVKRALDELIAYLRR